jgi:hypothetical protein
VAYFHDNSHAAAVVSPCVAYIELSGLLCVIAKLRLANEATGLECGRTPLIAFNCQVIVFTIKIGHVFETDIEEAEGKWFIDGVDVSQNIF